MGRQNLQTTTRTRVFRLVALGLIIPLMTIAVRTVDAQDSTEPPNLSVDQQETNMNHESPESSNTESSSTGNYNWRLPTMGGKQVWTDHRWWYGWRVQNNLLTGHWRLLDDHNVRHAWGTREACINKLDNVRKNTDHPPEPKTVVVLLHGLMRSSDSMNSLGKHLRENGYPVVVQFGYGSTRASIAEHAAAFRELIADLPGQPRLCFVGHSMGNIVFRHAIGDWNREENQDVLERIDRIVMLGPPNQGAAIAKRLSKTGLFGIVTGQAGMSLGPAWEELEKHLAIPACPFGIVMGNMERWSNLNPLVNGPSDMIVTVEEAQLEGAQETMMVSDIHSFLMDDPKVQQAIVRFFQGGTLNEVEPTEVEAPDEAT